MKNIVIIVLACLLIASGTIHFQFNKESINKIDLALRDINEMIQDAEKEASDYEGGIVLALILLRVEILKNTIAMLKQKRASLFHKIRLSYIAEKVKTQPSSRENLRSIRNDINNLSEEITKLEDEANQYEGGIILATILSNIQLQKLTKAMLEQRYYLTKHQIPFAFANMPNMKTYSPEESRKMGNVVEDEDAL